MTDRETYEWAMRRRAQAIAAANEAVYPLRKALAEYEMTRIPCYVKNPNGTLTRVFTDTEEACMLELAETAKIVFEKTYLEKVGDYAAAILNRSKNLY